MISSLIDFGFLVANEISIHFSRTAINYTTDEVLDYVLADNDSDLSGEKSEKDSDKKISENSSLNLDKMIYMSTQAQLVQTIHGKR